MSQPNTKLSPPSARQNGGSLAAHAAGQGEGTYTSVCDSQRFGMSEGAKQLQALLARRDFIMSCPQERALWPLRRIYGWIPADLILYHLDTQIWQQVVYIMCGELAMPARRVRGAA